MSDHLKIVRGAPTPEEVAVLTALLAATGSEALEPPQPVRGGWSDPARRLRTPPLPGPGAWRSSLR